MAAGPLTKSDIETALQEFKDPETGRSVVQTEQVRDIQVGDSSVSLTLALTTHSAPLRDDAKSSLEQLLRRRFPQLTAVNVTLAIHNRPPQKLGQLGLTAKSVIAVGSGKGGVGKSTIATCLAYALKQAGCKVGLMDADVYGPSIPKLTGVRGTQEQITGPNGLKPMDWLGIPVMSIGFLIADDQAVVWRGPMLHKLINDFLGQCDWGELDYLIVDMPPGTGDVALSLSQALPGNTGAVIVCTPQEVALLDAVRAIDMLKKVKVPVVGVVENMSGFVCPDCHKRYDIFGSGGARREAERLGIPFLGDVPINIQIRERGDQGATAANLDDPIVASHLKQLAYRLSRHLADRAAEKPPQITLPVL